MGLPDIFTAANVIRGNNTSAYPRPASRIRVPTPLGGLWGRRCDGAHQTLCLDANPMRPGLRVLCAGMTQMRGTTHMRCSLRPRLSPTTQTITHMPCGHASP